MSSEGPQIGERWRNRASGRASTVRSLYRSAQGIAMVGYVHESGVSQNACAVAYFVERWERDR